jgi:hypothetical protein
VTREVDQELLSLARGRLRSALADFRTGCPDAARLIPELDLLVEQVALRGLRLSDLTDRVAADFEAAGGGPDLVGVLRSQVTGDLGDLSAQPADASLPPVRLASFPVDGPLTPLQLPDQNPGAFASDFLGAVWDEVSGSAEGLLHAALHPMDTAHGLLGMLENPGDALRAIVDWNDLKSGDQGQWLGHMVPLMVLGTGGGLLARSLGVLPRFGQLAAKVRGALIHVASR